MRIVGVILVLLLVVASAAHAQVHGRIMDLHTGNGIAGASVRVVAAGIEREVITDAVGAYAITDLPAAEYWLVIRHPGYRDMSLRLALRDGSDLVLDVPLEIRPIPVSRLVVPVRNMANAYQAGTALDSLMPQIDSRMNGALRNGTTATLQDLVLADIHQQPQDPSGGPPRSLNIWGSSIERGRVLVDGATINAPLHLGAILPPLDPALLSSVALRTGGAPARYDGGSSYIMEYVTRAPRTDRLHAWGEFGMLIGRIGAETPISDESSVMLGARRINHEAVNALVDPSFNYQYGDVLARAAWQPDEDNALSAVVMATRETIRIPRDLADDGASWHNVASALSWRGDQDGSGPRMNASFSRGVVGLPLLSAPDGHLTATLDRSALSAEHAWSLDDFDVDAGLQLEHLQLARHSSASADPHGPVQAARPTLGEVACTLSLPCANAAATTAALFGDIAWQPASGFAVRAGLRTAFATNAARPHVLPRVALSWIGNGTQAATLSIGRYSQVAVIEPFAAELMLPSEHLRTATEYTTQAELRLAHHSQRVALEASAFLRRDDSRDGSESTLTPGADLSWAVVLKGNRIFGGYSLLARRTLADSLPGYQHLAFIGVGTGTGPVQLDVSARYSAGVPLTSIVLDRPAVSEFASTFADTDAPPVTSAAGPFMRVDAVLSGDWTVRLRNRDVRITPYAQLINAFSQRGALFYFREGDTADLQPLSALPTMPVLGVRWVF